MPDRIVRRVAALRHPVALVSVAAAGAVRGIDYLTTTGVTPSTGRAVALIDGFLPLWAYAALWLGASVALLVGMVVHKRTFVWAGSITVGLWGLWAIAFTLSQVTGNSSGVLTGAAFGAVCLCALALIQEEVTQGTVGD